MPLLVNYDFRIGVYICKLEVWLIFYDLKLEFYVLRFSYFKYVVLWLLVGCLCACFNSRRGCLGETCLFFLSGVSCAFTYAGRFASLLVGVERNVNFILCEWSGM